MADDFHKDNNPVQARGATTDRYTLIPRIKGDDMEVCDLADLGVLLYMAEFYYDTRGYAIPLQGMVLQVLSRLTGRKISSLSQLYELRRNSRHAGAPAKYSAEDRKKICQLRSEGHTIHSIAVQLDISYSTVQRILSRE